MTWAYRIAKKKDISGTTRYQLVEAFMNDDGDIFAFSGHQDPFYNIQCDDYKNADELREEIKQTLSRLLRDTGKPIIDVDNFAFADSGLRDDDYTVVPNVSL